jgi:hypothetical protein
MDIGHLIVLVSDRQEIYNPCHPKHRDRDFVAGVWREIATQSNKNIKLFYSIK